MRIGALLLLLGGWLAAEWGAGLECYSDFNVTGGRAVGTNPVTCESKWDKCFNATQKLHGVTRLMRMAGCSSVRCLVVKDRCARFELVHRYGTVCCCTTDLCNFPRGNELNSTVDEIDFA